jgi:hypothetical protein
MTNTSLSKAKLLLSASAMLASMFCIAAPAQARGIVADFALPPVVAACTSLAQQSCSVSNFVNNGLTYDFANSGLDHNTPAAAGIFGNVYVYAQGIISIGSPLPPTASINGGLNAANLGNNFIAPGLSNYYLSPAANERVLVSLIPDDNTALPNELRVYWVFNDPANQLDIFGLDLITHAPNPPNPPIPPSASVGYGTFLSDDTWFNEANFGAPPFCDALCVSTTVGGAELPGDALVGSSYPDGPGSNIAETYFFNFTLTSSTTASVPEPSAWSIMLAGLCALCGIAWQVRGRRTGTKNLKVP